MRGEAKLLGVHLPTLRLVQRNAAVYSIVKGHDALFHIPERLLGGDAIEIEHVGRRQTARTILPIGAVVGLEALLAELLAGLLFLRKIRLGGSRVFGDLVIEGLDRLRHVLFEKELLDVELPLPHIVFVDVDEIGAHDVEAALLQDPALIGDIP